jgi:predicted dehydrogenase
MTGRKITLIGCGGWGARIARKLAELGATDRLVLVDEVEHRVAPLAGALDCEWSKDPFGYLGVSGTQSSSVEGGVVIVATPPESHLGVVRAVFGGYGIAPTHLRIEKPLASCVEDAEQIRALCELHGTTLTTGFTLLHHPLYEAAFDYMRATGFEPESVSGVRIGKPARHRADALLDIGVHTASIGAYLDVYAECRAGYSDVSEVRRTTLFDPFFDAPIVIDELAGTVTTPDGPLTIRVGVDALERDLAAWMQGTHRGTPDVAIRTQLTVEREIGRVAA